MEFESWMPAFNFNINKMTRLTSRTIRVLITYYQDAFDIRAITDKVEPHYAYLFVIK